MAIRSPSKSSGAKRMRPTSVAKSKRRTKRKQTVVRIGRQTFPLQLGNTMKYCSEIQLTTSGAGISNYLFSTNGMYDPDITGTGTQPLYFDQLMAIYNHYNVVRSRIKVTPTSATAYPVMCVVYVDDDTTTGTTADTPLALQRPGARRSWLGSSIGKDPTVYHNWDAVKHFGGNVQSNDDLQGNAGANPVEQMYYVCHFKTDTVSTTVNFWVEIEYDVIWDELKSMTAS